VYDTIDNLLLTADRNPRELTYTETLAVDAISGAWDAMKTQEPAKLNRLAIAAAVMATHYPDAILLRLAEVLWKADTKSCAAETV